VRRTCGSAITRYEIRSTFRQRNFRPPAKHERNPISAPECRTLIGLFQWPNTGIDVTRPTRYGNPYKVAEVGSNTEAVRLFRADLLAGHLRVTVEDVRRGPRGRHLYCFCKQGELTTTDPGTVPVFVLPPCAQRTTQILHRFCVGYSK